MNTAFLHNFKRYAAETRFVISGYIYAYVIAVMWRSDQYFWTDPFFAKGGLLKTVRLKFGVYYLFCQFIRIFRLSFVVFLLALFSRQGRAQSLCWLRGRAHPHLLLLKVTLTVRVDSIYWYRSNRRVNRSLSCQYLNKCLGDVGEGSWWLQSTLVSQIGFGGPSCHFTPAQSGRGVGRLRVNATDTWLNDHKRHVLHEPLVRFYYNWSCPLRVESAQ